MIPVTVIGGYLGAGKTTLINGLLRGTHGRRLAVLVNDFGAIDIDARLLADHDGDTISLANGCVCCTIADALGDALNKVSAMRPAPDHIVIEASGVANPAKIAMYGQGWPGLRLDGIIVMADAESVRARSEDKFVGGTVRQQLTAADLLVLNKMDLLTRDQCDLVRQWLETQAPDGRIATACHGDLPASVLLGQIAAQDRRYQAQGDGMARHDTYRAVPFRTARPLDRIRLGLQIASWPAGILRAKGLVHIFDDPGYAYILQLVGARYTLEKGPAWGKERPVTEIVVIAAAADLNPGFLESSLLSACL
ncbi:MAG: GTP-binding protein [Proteobacteria bacterium]|nr:GTP-binding protein [Pseudomonadota bacterium]